MTDPTQVIPYASTAKPSPGLSLGAILAIFAIAQAIPAFLNNFGLVGNLRYWMGSIHSSAAMTILNWLHLASVLGLLAGAVLLLCKRSIGSTIVATVCVLEVLILAPLFVSIVWSAGVGTGSSSTQQGVIWAGVLLTWAAAVTWVWLVCRLVAMNRLAPVIDGSGWSAAATSCAWSILIFALCQCLAILVTVAGLAMGHQHGILSSSARPITAAAAFLAIGGLGAVLRRDWSRRLCMIVAMAWALHPAATFIYYVWRSANLTFTLQFIDATWIGEQIEHFPLAILWILLLTHPQIRACWGSASEEHMAPLPQECSGRE